MTEVKGLWRIHQEYLYKRVETECQNIPGN